MNETILYLERPGPKNTEVVISAVAKRRELLNIEYIAVASNSGDTAMKLWQALDGTGTTLVSVAGHTGYRGGDSQDLTEEQRRKMEEKGIKVLIGSHALSGVGRSISQKFGGVSCVEIVAHTLRLFACDGLKVAVEVAVMVADAGLVPTDREIIAIGGTGGGADCAIVLRAAHMNNFFDLEIREIITKPRTRGK